jgi:hypothetical protein
MNAPAGDLMCHLDVVADSWTGGSADGRFEQRAIERRAKLNPALLEDSDLEGRP